jgi:hypothetical protein
MGALCNAQTVPPEFSANGNETGNRHPDRKLLPELATENEPAVEELPIRANKLVLQGGTRGMCMSKLMCRAELSER